MPVIEKGSVIKNDQISEDIFELEFLAPAVAREGLPGQFVHIRTALGAEPLLRRLFSLYDVNKKRGGVALLYKVVGQGTEIMTRLKAGKDYIDVVGPLGKGFTIAQDADRLLLIGGGVGIAPLVYLARVLKEKGHRLQVLYGAGFRREMAALAKLEQLDVDILPATVDGSVGFKGTVVDLLERELVDLAAGFIYVCGPEIMMAKVRQWAEKRGIKGEASLEEQMACGVGACLGCARQLKPEDEFYIKVCKDGPVFALEGIELRAEEV